MIRSQSFDITEAIFAHAGWMPNQEYLSTESTTRKLLLLKRIKCIYENVYKIFHMLALTVNIMLLSTARLLDIHVLNTTIID